MTTDSATDAAQEWPAQWLRGPLPLCALRVIARHGPLHGYAITRHLAEAGLGTIGGGTLYPLLGRFERDGLVATDWVAGANGPARKVYTLTGLGAERLEADAERWRRFAQTTTALVTTAASVAATSPVPTSAATTSAATASPATRRPDTAPTPVTKEGTRP